MPVRERRKRMHRYAAFLKIFPIAALVMALACVLAGCDASQDDTVVLRVCNWEEYIDEGGWDDDEAIELEDGRVIKGEENMCNEFEQWYRDNYGVNVKVEYSCFGTNEDVYNQLNIGSTFDLICPSDYLIMKLMKEKRLEPYSEDFFDESREYNYYVRCVSPYIENVFEENETDGEPWSRYAAGYMWGTSGIVYNTDNVDAQDARHWDILNDRDYYRRVSIKDNVRDSFFAALAIDKSGLLMSEDFRNADDYGKRLADEMNDTDEQVVGEVCDILKDIKDNAYSFETDSAKADMAAGKVDICYQWSGDAVYTMQVAAENGVNLNYRVPDECGNLWFDGWVMLKDGIAGDAAKKQAAQAFVNYLSRPDNAIRNMYYIGYTSAISGGDDPAVYEYAKQCYEAEGSDTIDYDVSYFFEEGVTGGAYVITADAGSEYGELGARYPDLQTIERCAVMENFDDEAYERINQMWIDVRCFNLKEIF